MWPWPEPPALVAQQLAIMAAEEDEDAEDVERVDLSTGEVADGPVTRPWDLSALGGELKPSVFGWLDEVVMWLNHSYGWQESQIIPACWPDHQGLALDLAALAFGRLDAYATATAAYVGRWHSDWEDFQRRMSAMLGDAGRECRRGEHSNPGEYTVNAVFQIINKRAAAR